MTNDAPLRCVECGRKAPPDARGWRAYLTYDGEPVTYCPECAEREFEVGQRGVETAR
jgi:hypothetical protein